MRVNRVFHRVNSFTCFLNFQEDASDDKFSTINDFQRKTLIKTVYKVHLMHFLIHVEHRVDTQITHR